MINNRYRKNSKKTVFGFNLEITPTGTVYNCTPRGMVKLQSLFDKKTGFLNILFPDGRTVDVMPTKYGIKTAEEVRLMRRVAKAV